MENKTLEERISALEKEVQELKYKQFNVEDFVRGFVQGFKKALHETIESLQEENM